jgi:hypothetical protein
MRTATGGRVVSSAADSAERSPFRFGRDSVALGLMCYAVADLSLLPMFHVAGVPIKPAYGALLLAFLLLLKGQRANLPTNQRFVSFAILVAILVMSLSALIGYCITDMRFGIDNFAQTARQLVVFGLMMAAFWVGTQVRGFPWLLAECVLWLHGILILLLCWAPESVPWLVQLWWKSPEVIAERIARNADRPTPFGDNSMVVMNVLFLALGISAKSGGYRLCAPIVTVGLTVTVSLVLASRNQIVFTGIVSALLLSIGSKGGPVRSWLYLAVILGACAVLIPSLPMATDWVDRSFGAGQQAISKLGVVLDDGARDTDSIARPMRHLSTMQDRFWEGPVFGTGYSVGKMPPFDYMNMHNDFLWVLAASGLVGALAYIALIIGVFRLVGALSILPFFLPGLTNSFLMGISACLLYFFFVGQLAQSLPEKKRGRNPSCDRGALNRSSPYERLARPTGRAESPLMTRSTNSERH